MTLLRLHGVSRMLAMQGGVCVREHTRPLSCDTASMLSAAPVLDIPVLPPFVTRVVVIKAMCTVHVSESNLSLLCWYVTTPPSSPKVSLLYEGKGYCDVLILVIHAGETPARCWQLSRLVSAFVPRCVVVPKRCRLWAHSLWSCWFATLQELGHPLLPY